MKPVDAALSYASVMGWAVFPVNARTKHPLAGTHGHLDASCHAPDIYKMFDGPLGVGVAVATGRESGLLVVDVDEKSGRSGSSRLKAEGLELPPTAVAQTRSGGNHWFYKYAEGARCKNDLLGGESGVDVKAEGGYVVVWPTPGYSWRLHGYKLVPAMLNEPPSWAIIRKGDGSLRLPSVEDAAEMVSTSRLVDAFTLVEEAAKRVALAPSGERNEELNRVAFSAGLLVAGGWIDEEHLVGELRRAAKIAGLTDKETGWTIASGLRGARRDRG